MAKKATKLPTPAEVQDMKIQVIKHKLSQFFRNPFLYALQTHKTFKEAL